MHVYCLLLWCLLALSSHAVSGQAAVNLYVSPSGSDSNTCTTSTTPCLSISAAITQAQYSAINNIYLADGVYSGTLNTNLKFGTKSVNLLASNGASAQVVLDGTGQYSILSHNAGTLTATQLSNAGLDATSTAYLASSFSNIVLRNAYTNTVGVGGAVTVIGALVSGTNATYNTFNQFTFNNCTFVNNTAGTLVGTGGSAVYASNAITGTVDALQFNGCTFTSNILRNTAWITPATGLAAVPASSVFATVTLLNTNASFYNSLFTYNAVPIVLITSTVNTFSNIYNTSWINNTATALAVTGTHALNQTLVNIINTNLGGSRTIADIFSSAMAYISSGAWFADRSIWDNSTVNTAVSMAHLFTTSGSSTNVTAVLSNCQFSRGTGYRAAAGEPSSGVMNYTNCSFWGNSGTQLGTVFFWTSAQSVTYFNNCSFINNTGNALLYTYNTVQSVYDGCTFKGNNGGGQAGTAFYIQPITTAGVFNLTVQNSEFSDNISGGTALISSKYTQLNAGGSQSLFVNNTFTNNTGDGGSVFQLASDGSAVIVGCTFINNTAASTGGAVETSLGSQLSISNSLFEGNSASSQGGAVYDGAMSAYSGNTFIGNSAGSISSQGSGGAIFIADILLNAYNTITDATILSTSHTYAACGSAFTNNNTFIGNSADEGAAIFIDGEYPLCYANALCQPGQCTFTNNVAASYYGSEIGMVLDSIQVLHVNQFANSSIAGLTASRLGQYQYASTYLSTVNQSTAFLTDAVIYPGLGFDLFVQLLDKSNNTYSFYNTYVPVLQLSLASTTPYNSSSASSMETNGGLAVFTNTTIYATPGSTVTANFLIASVTSNLQTSVALRVGNCPAGYILSCGTSDLLCGCTVRPAYLVGEQISSSVSATGLVLSMLLYVVGSYATSMCWQRSLETLAQANGTLARYMWISITSIMLGVILTWCPAVLAVSEVSVSNLSVDLALDGRLLLISLAISAGVSFCCLNLLLHHPSFKVVQRNRVTVGEDSYTLASENDLSVGSRSSENTTLKRDSVTGKLITKFTVRSYVQAHLPLIGRFLRQTLAKAKKWQLLVAAVLLICNTICCNFLVLYSVIAPAHQSTTTAGVAVSLALGITLYLLLIPMFLFHRGSYRWALTVLFGGSLMVLEYPLLYGQTYNFSSNVTNGFGATTSPRFGWVPDTLFLVSLVLGLMAALFCFAIVVSYMQLSRFELTQRVLLLQKQEAEDLKKTRKTVERISHTSRLVNVMQQSYQWPKADNIDKLATLTAAAEQPILRKLLTTYMQSARDGLADVLDLTGWWGHLDSAPSLQFAHESLSLAAVVHSAATRPYVLAEASTISYQALNAFNLLYAVTEFNRVVQDPATIAIAFTLARSIVRQQLAVSNDYHTKPINNLLWFELERKLTTVTKVELASSVLSNKLFQQVEKALYKEATGRWWPQIERSSSGYIVHLLMKKQHVN